MMNGSTTGLAVFWRRAAVLATGMLLSYATVSSATTITFNNGSFVSPGNPPVLAPHNMTIVESGFDVEGWWAADVGSATGTFVDAGHFHNVNNNESQHFNSSAELQGLLIEKVGDTPFKLTSLDFTVNDNTSINGFNSNQVFVLVSVLFNPTSSVSSQFTQFAVNGTGTLSIAGFDNVSKIFVSSSASVAFDNIVLDAPTAVPEPASMILLGSGLVGFAVRRRRARR